MCFSFFIIIYILYGIDIILSLNLIVCFINCLQRNFFHSSLDLTLYRGAMKYGRQVAHHQNIDFKNIEHYIDDVIKNNAICLIYDYTKQLLHKHKNSFQYKFISCKQFIKKTL